MVSHSTIITPWLSRAFECACGQRHEVTIRHVDAAPGALARLPEYCAAEGLRRVAVAADARTLTAAGARTAELLAAAGVDARVIVLEDTREGEVVADEAGLVGLLKELPPDAEAVIAVGAGTIHDMVRFACHVGRRRFLSVPTAPSVDGFASVGAPLVIKGFKNTYPAMAPEAIFADLNVLCRAPREMIAAGFGDMLGKYTSLADWRLGQLLTGEHYCPVCADITKQALEACIAHVEDIAAVRPEGIRVLTEALILSGISILLLGNSRPASGAEHHLSHFWEMRFLQEGRKALLHGAKVGAATVAISGLYQKLARLLEETDAAKVAARLQSRPGLDREHIVRAYGTIAPHVLKENGLNATEEAIPGDGRPSVAEEAAGRLCAGMRKRLADNRDAVLETVRSVPSPERIAGWLAAAGGAVTPGELGISGELVGESLDSACYVRSRLTVLRLACMMEGGLEA